MKITKTITVDLDVWEEAQKHIDNISGYVNDCLKGYSNSRSDDKINIERLKIELEENIIEMNELSKKQALIRQLLKDAEKNVLIKNKEVLDNEQYNRWICPVCKQQNFMDSISCSKCNLKTRNESKTVIINIKGDAN